MFCTVLKLCTAGAECGAPRSSWTAARTPPASSTGGCFNAWPTGTVFLVQYGPISDSLCRNYFVPAPSANHDNFHSKSNI